MIEAIGCYAVFSIITLFTLYWGLTFIAQVKNGEQPRVKINLNPVQRFERAKKQAIDKQDVLKNG